MTKAEEIVRANILAKLREGVVHNIGWPDFLVRDDDGEVFAVEVKGPGDRLSPSQKVMHADLEDAGVPVFVAYVSKHGHVYYERYSHYGGERATEIELDDAVNRANAWLEKEMVSRAFGESAKRRG